MKIFKKLVGIVIVAVVAFLVFWAGKIKMWIDVCREHKSDPEGFKEWLEDGTERVTQMDDSIEELKNTIKGEES